MLRECPDGPWYLWMRAERSPVRRPRVSSATQSADRHPWMSISSASALQSVRCDARLRRGHHRREALAHQEGVPRAQGGDGAARGRPGRRAGRAAARARAAGGARGRAAARAARDEGGGAQGGRRRGRAAAAPRAGGRQRRDAAAGDAAAGLFWRRPDERVDGELQSRRRLGGPRAQRARRLQDGARDVDRVGLGPRRAADRAAAARAPGARDRSTDAGAHRAAQFGAIRRNSAQLGAILPTPSYPLHRCTSRFGST